MVDPDLIAFFTALPVITLGTLAYILLVIR